MGEPADSDRAREIRRLLDEGLATDRPDEMLRCFEAAHRLNLNDPAAMSAHGMALAVVRHQYQQGLVFCEEAVRRAGPGSFVLVNLGKAYMAASNKREAARCFRRALDRSGGTDARARAELNSMGFRRTPVIPFLSRSFPLNKWLGKLRHNLSERQTAKLDGRDPVPAELGRLSGSYADAVKTLEAGQPDRKE